MKHPVVLLKDLAQGHCVDLGILPAPVGFICKLFVLQDQSIDGNLQLRVV